MSAERNSTTQPAERWPFKPGEAVYFSLKGAVKQPLTCVHATVISAPRALFGAAHADLTVQRADQERPKQQRCHRLAYRGYCPACLVPAIDDVGTLRCPVCGQAAHAEPLPDALVWRLFPRDQWYTPMEIRRAFEHPDWTRGMIDDHVSATLDRAYTAALARLALEEPDTRSTEDFDGWTADYAAIRMLHFYALIGDDAAFLATYEQLKQRQEGVEMPTYAPPVWPFQVGEAIYWWPHVGFTGPRPFYAGVVARVGAATSRRVTVQLDDGRKRSVDASNLVYQGFCPRCEAPAVVGHRLRCPRCEQAAEAMPPPEELIRRWFHHGHVSDHLWLREVLLTGCTWEEARDHEHEREAEARAAKKQHEWDTVLGLAELGMKVAQSFHNATKDDAEDLPSKRLDLAPLDIAQPAGDDVPDGEDTSAFAVWLRGQLEA